VRKRRPSSSAPDQVLADELRRLAADPLLGPSLTNYLSQEARAVLGIQEVKGIQEAKVKVA
jgi:hypothetical protein